MAVTNIDTPPHEPPAARPGSTPRHMVLLLLGAVVALLGLALTGAAAGLGAAVFQQRSHGYITSPTERYSVDSYAITSE